MPRRRSSPPAADDMIRILLVEPHALVGVGVRDVVDREPDMEIVAEVRYPADAMRVVEEASPDVLLLDVELQAPDASEATRRLTQETPGSAVVVIGGEDDDASILEAIEVGATARVSAMAEPRELVAVIRRVADGEDPLKDELIGRPELVDRIVEAVREGFRRTEEQPLMPLTPREMDILRLVADGLRNREIAVLLEVNEQTVKNHITSILHKLGVPNRTQAVTFAVRQGWLDLDQVSAGSASAGSESSGAPG